MRHLARPAVFLDRDGTMGGEGGFNHPETFTLFPFTIKAISILRSLGFQVVMISNQFRVSTGEITLDQVHKSCQRIETNLLAHGTDLDGWYICPHAPDDRCSCRKPEPGMLLRAARDLSIDLRASYMIGDMGQSDMVAAHRAGCRPVLVLTGLGQGSIREYRHTWLEVEPWAVATDLLDAARRIQAHEDGRKLGQRSLAN